MARGTDFGGVHSSRNLNLIQQRVEIEPAEPKLNLVDVPGADGSKDLSTQPAGRITYKDRKITWTFALYPGQNWGETHRSVSNALNGKECKITLDDDPGYYYQGRLAVKKYNLDGLLRQITVEAICRPYALKQAATVKTASLTTTYKTISLPNEKKTAIPTISVTVASKIRWNGAEVAVQAGASFTSLDIVLQPGNNTLEAKTNSGTGSITITYQEGAL